MSSISLNFNAEKAMKVKTKRYSWDDDFKLSRVSPRR